MNQKDKNVFMAEIKNVRRSIDGDTGRLKIVAEVQPTDSKGTVIVNLPEKLNVKVGDFIDCLKQKDTTPIATFVYSYEQENFDSTLLSKCDCGKSTFYSEVEVAYFCQSLSCSKRWRSIVFHFCEVLDIEVPLGLFHVIELKSPVDLFRISYEKYRKIYKGFQDEDSMSHQQFTNHLESRKKTTFAKFIHALGIRYVGEEVGKQIAAFFYDHNYNLYDLVNYSERLSQSNINLLAVHSIQHFFSQETNRDLVCELFNLGFTLCAE